MRSLRAESHASVLGCAPDTAATGCEAQAKVINDRFQRKLAGLRRLCRPWKIPAVVRGLQDERRSSLQLLRERHDAKRLFERQARKRLLPPPKGP